MVLCNSSVSYHNSHYIHIGIWCIDFIQKVPAIVELTHWTSSWLMPSLLLSCCYLEYIFWVWMSFYRTYHLHHLVVELFIQQNTPYTCILSTYQNVEHSMFTPLTFHIVVWIKHFVCTTNITKVAQVWCCYDADLQIHAQSSQPGIGKDMCCNEQWDYIMHKLAFKSPTHSSFASSWPFLPNSPGLQRFDEVE